MSYLKRLLLVKSFLLFILFTMSGQNSHVSEIIPGKYILQFGSHEELTSFTQKNTILRNQIVTESVGRNLHLITIYRADLNDSLLKSIIAENQGIIAWQHDRTISLRTTTPNDALYGDQWDMDKIKAPGFWDFTTGGKTSLGHDIVVAVIDNGFRTNHPDLIDNIFVNSAEIPSNGIDDDNNGFIDDINGASMTKKNGTHDVANHGTNVLGIVGARGNNNIGITGVNWDVKLLPISHAPNISSLIEGYDYALGFRKLFNRTNGEEGALIVAANLSAGAEDLFPSDAPIWCNMYDSLGVYGVLSSGATTNASKNVDVVGDLPSTCPSDYLIVVTNTNNLDRLTSAGYGPTSVDLSAPGDGNISTDSDSGYSAFNSTSCATPHVAGAIALMYADDGNEIGNKYLENPSYIASSIKQAIMKGVDLVSDLNGKTVSGGRLNLFRTRQVYSRNRKPTEIDNLSVFPNPTNDFLYIKMNNFNYDNTQFVTISGADGKLVRAYYQDDIKYSGETFKIPVYDLAPGFYLIQMRTEESFYIARFVKSGQY